MKLLTVARNVFLNWVLPLAALLLVMQLMQWWRRPDVQLQDGLAPEFELVDTTGEPVALSDFRGQDVIVNFWGTWCGPCRAELPGLSHFARNNPGVPMLGVAVDSGNWKRLAAEKERLGISFTVLEGKGRVQRDYGVSTVPTTFLIDGEGRVARTHVGVITPMQLAAWVR